MTGERRPEPTDAAKETRTMNTKMSAADALRAARIYNPSTAAQHAAQHGGTGVYIVYTPYDATARLGGGWVVLKHGITLGPNPYRDLGGVFFRVGGSDTRAASLDNARAWAVTRGLVDEGTTWRPVTGLRGAQFPAADAALIRRAATDAMNAATQTDDDQVEGCPDCGRDEVERVPDEDGDPDDEPRTRCTACGWVSL